LPWDDLHELVRHALCPEDEPYADHPIAFGSVLWNVACAMPKPVESAIEHMERLNAALLIARVKSDALGRKIDRHLKRLRSATAALDAASERRRKNN
jgi:hypothetical protein